MWIQEPYKKFNENYTKNTKTQTKHLLSKKKRKEKKEIMHLLPTHCRHLARKRKQEMQMRIKAAQDSQKKKLSFCRTDLKGICWMTNIRT